MLLWFSRRCKTANSSPIRIVFQRDVKKYRMVTMFKEEFWPTKFCMKDFFSQYPWRIQRFFGETNYGSRAKPWWRPGGQVPGSSKDLVLWNHLLFIKICFICFFFQKFEFEVNFSVQSLFWPVKTLRIYKLLITLFTT